MDADATTTLKRPLSGRLDPQVEAYLAQLRAMELPPLDQVTPQQMREGLKARIGSAAGPTREVARVTQVEVPGPGGDVTVRAYHPAPGEALPVLMFFHGGGWVIGDIDTHDDLCRDLALDAGCLVLSVDYRLAPEHPFPAGLDDCLAATRWAAEQADTLGGDPARLLVGGDSAGGNFAAVIAQDCRDQGIALAGQVLIYPCTDLSRTDTESYAQCAAGYGLERDTIFWYRKQYLADPDAVTNPRVSPARAQVLSGLTPAIIVTNEFDVLRSEGEDYARRLQAAGVPVRLARFDGMIHAFVSFAGLFDQARRARDLLAREIRSLTG